MAMATTKKKTSVEPDGVYFLKLVLYVVLGSFWLKFATPLHIGDFMLHGLPLGLFVGLIFASHDHFRVDRKIEYAILVLVTIVTFFLPAGIVL